VSTKRKEMAVIVYPYYQRPIDINR
jgi:hypothetical protein